MTFAKFDCVVTRLQKWIGFGGAPPGGLEFDTIRIGGTQSRMLPIFHFQQQHAATRIQNDKVGLPAFGPSGTLCQTQ